MQNSIYLINPREKRPAANSREVLGAWGKTNVVGMADLSTTTVAAMVPSDWSVSICDERIQPVDFDTNANIIGITGKVSQRDRMIELAREFRQRGKVVMIGGPYATLSPNDIRPHADILVTGEAEEIAAKIFADIAARDWQKEYTGTKPDLNLSPIPRWDLYPRSLAMGAQIQTSRGCPFECEFCDVIQYLGRKQRWKDPERVVQELDVLYAQGYRSIFFADDNFTVMRRRAHALLERVAEWNDQQNSGRAYFSTQVSIDLAKDADLMALCFRAGLHNVFIGVETPNKESLAESSKRQNLRVDLAEEVRKVVAAGMTVTAGMIVGFDHDRPDIFEHQAAFIASIPVPNISINLLVAPSATPLYARLAKEGRLTGEEGTGGGGLLETNIRPLLMSEADLRIGMIWLVNRIYAPRAFGRRVQDFADSYPEVAGQARSSYYLRALPLARHLSAFGPEEKELLELMDNIVHRRPGLRRHLMDFLNFYCQMRYRMEQDQMWQPDLAHQDAPMAA